MSMCKEFPQNVTMQAHLTHFKIMHEVQEGDVNLLFVMFAVYEEDKTSCVHFDWLNTP